MPSKNLNDLTPDTRLAAEQLLQYARSQGIDFVVTQTLRTCDYQNELYAQGRTTPGAVVTGTPGCRSWHTHGRALDLLVMDGGQMVGDGTDPRYEKLGMFARTLGFRWGGDFGDPGHFEFHPGLTIGQVCPDPMDCLGLNPPGSVKPADVRLGDAQASVASNTGLAIFAACLAGVGAFLVTRKLARRKFAAVSLLT